MKIIAAALCLTISGAVVFLRADLGAVMADDEPPTYILAPVDRGPIETVVASSGALGAVATVLVSSQVSGQMLKIHADYNTEVNKGDILGEIDPLTFQNAVDAAAADLAVAEANTLIHENLLRKARADLQGALSQQEGAHIATAKEQIALGLARKAVERKKSLSQSGSLSSVDFANAQAALDTAAQNVRAAESAEKTKALLAEGERSRLKSVEAAVAHAHAQVAQKRATLKAAQTNLDLTKIRAPTNGVVIGRSIEEGQLVSTTIQTQQTLFTVAQDLSEMQIKISVDEADIGKVRPGQLVNFRVDSYPNREFSGRVKQVRLDAKPVQNVVTYEVVASAPNPERILLPGMTANARIVIDAREDAIKVPVAALRFRPANSEGPATAHVWTLDEGRRPRAVPVKTGLSDRQMVEVTTPAALERVIVGMASPSTAPSLAKRIMGSL